MQVLQGDEEHYLQQLAYFAGQQDLQQDLQRVRVHTRRNAGIADKRVLNCRRFGLLGRLSNEVARSLVIVALVFRHVTVHRSPGASGNSFFSPGRQLHVQLLSHKATMASKYTSTKKQFPGSWLRSMCVLQ
ncbi:hypothetical protein [Variovorax paradoxus]|uniref:hypothetical protein n=1 Tax=Variovorax paradoxus TaxID=34073 RepID=UPI003D646DC8